MTNAIDYPRCEERYPQHLYSEDHNSNASEENDVGDGNNDNAGEQELISILRNYGEERFARKIVGKILASRHIKPLESTTELTELISSSIPRKLQKKGLNPATLTFQALRIAVNNELQELETTLSQAISVIGLGGRLAVISYHSLEDRLVKRFFRNGMFEGEPERDFFGNYEVPFKIIEKLIVPDAAEIASNNRARSAKLRVAEKKIK